MNWLIVSKRCGKFRVWANELRCKISEYPEKLVIQLKMSNYANQ
jgi:hypothetical protein